MGGSFEVVPKWWARLVILLLTLMFLALVVLVVLTLYISEKFSYLEREKGEQINYERQIQR